jgi:hypothetical protein
MHVQTSGHAAWNFLKGFQNAKLSLIMPMMSFVGKAQPISEMLLVFVDIYASMI